MSKTMSYCPHCQAVNMTSVDEAKTKTPVCGKCGANLPMHSLVSEVDQIGFSKILRNADLPVVVDFWAPWCGPCRQFAPTFEASSKEFGGKVIFLKVNTEDHPGVAQQYGIRGIPSLLVFKNGAEANRQSGAMPKEMFNNWLSQNL
jgi:thioredoxin 2